MNAGLGLEEVITLECPQNITKLYAFVVGSAFVVGFTH